MKKQLFLLFFFLHINIYPMEINTQQIIPSLFHKLPLEILNKIASLLIFKNTESEIEFINRTKQLKKQNIPDQYLSFLPTKNPATQEFLYSACCPNNNTLAILHSFYNRTPCNSTLIFINKINNQTFHTQSIPFSCSKIAVSRKGNMFAFTTVLITDINSIGDLNKHNEQLIIQTINTTIQNFNIPNTFLLRQNEPAIAFNKQGTLVIIHGTDTTRTSNQFNRHIIIPLNIHTVNPHSHRNDNQKTLIKYFKQKGICKNNYQQIPKI